MALFRARDRDQDAAVTNFLVREMPPGGPPVVTHIPGPVPTLQNLGDKVKPRKVYTWSCAYCGQPFETTHYGQRYCKRSCQNKAYYERRRNNKP